MATCYCLLDKRVIWDRLWRGKIVVMWRSTELIAFTILRLPKKGQRTKCPLRKKSAKRTIFLKGGRAGFLSCKAAAGTSEFEGFSSFFSFSLPYVTFFYFINTLNTFSFLHSTHLAKILPLLSLPTRPFLLPLLPFNALTFLTFSRFTPLLLRVTL